MERMDGWVTHMVVNYCLLCINADCCLDEEGIGIGLELLEQPCEAGE